MFLKKLSVTLLLFVGTVLIANAQTRANANEVDLEYRKGLIVDASIGPKLFISFAAAIDDEGDDNVEFPTYLNIGFAVGYGLRGSRFLGLDRLLDRLSLHLYTELTPPQIGIGYRYFLPRSDSLYNSGNIGLGRGLKLIGLRGDFEDLTYYVTTEAVGYQLSKDIAVELSTSYRRYLSLGDFSALVDKHAISVSLMIRYVSW